MKILETEYERIGRVTICRIYTIWQGEHLVFNGVSIRHPQDKHNQAVGELLAWQRAQAKILKRVQRWVEGQIKLAEHNASIVHRSFADYLAEIGDQDQAAVDSEVESEVTDLVTSSFFHESVADKVVALNKPEPRVDTYGRRLFRRNRG